MRLVALMLGTALLLVGCGGGGGGGAGDGSTGTHSAGWPIVTGEWPFDATERCGEDGTVEAPGCILTGDDGERRLASLAAAGSVFTSDVDVTVTYRGGMVLREPNGDPANPETRRAFAFVDVTFPDEHPGEDELLLTKFVSDGPEDFGFSFSGMGSADGRAWPNGEGTYDGVLYRPDPGETLTLAVAIGASGPTNLLGEEDPTVDVTSGYSYNLGADHRESGRASLALLDQDPDTDVLADVRDSIERVAAYAREEATGGLDSFESTFERWLAGAEMVSHNGLDGGSDEGSDGDLGEPGPLPGDDVDGGGETLPPPPPPVPSEPADDADELSADELYLLGQEAGRADFEAGRNNGATYFDPAPDRPDYEDGYRDGWDQAEREEVDAGSSGTGRSYAQPQLHEDPWMAAMMMVEGLQTEPVEFQECKVTPASYPCLSISQHTHNNGTDHRAVVKVRLGAGDRPTDYDFALLITAVDPTGDGWVVDSEWTFGDGEKPGWVW